MAARLMRFLVGAIGVLAILVAVRIWLAPAMVGATLGLTPAGALGLATLRADVAGFFGAAGVLALAGAIRDHRGLLTAPLVMLGLALTGRLVSVAMGGLSAPQVPPMIIEAVLLVLLALGRRSLGASRT